MENLHLLDQGREQPDITHLPTRHAWRDITADCFGPVLQRSIQPSAAGHVVQYGVGICHQVSPSQVALLVNRRVTGVAVVDLEDGWDVLVFDRLHAVRPEKIQPGLANTHETHPRSGEPLTMVNYIPQGGFVPLGAKLADGSSHPHAGTGFGVAEVVGYPTHNRELRPYMAPDLHGYLQLLQYAFDAERFTVTRTDNLPHDRFIPGYRAINRALGPAVPDGADLLVGMVNGRDDGVANAHAARLEREGRKPHHAAQPVVGECYGSGLARFRRGRNGWRCIDYVPVPRQGPDMAFEPSVIRDRDGSLLMTMRGQGTSVPPGTCDAGLENTFEHFRVYRSTDNGRSWESTIHLPQLRAPTPVTINQTAAGDVYLASNPYRPVETDSRGRTVSKSHQRASLWLWPVNHDRRGVGEPFCLLDCNKALGPPRPHEGPETDNRWWADHVVSSVVRLADGRQRALLSFRVTDAATTSGGALPSPHAGVWLAELHHQSKEAMPSPWHFD